MIELNRPKPLPREYGLPRFIDPEFFEPKTRKQLAQLLFMMAVGFCFGIYFCHKVYYENDGKVPPIAQSGFGLQLFWWFAFVIICFCLSIVGIMVLVLLEHAFVECVEGFCMFRSAQRYWEYRTRLEVYNWEQRYQDAGLQSLIDDYEYLTSERHQASRRNLNRSAYFTFSFGSCCLVILFVLLVKLISEFIWTEITITSFGSLAGFLCIFVLYMVYLPISSALSTWSEQRREGESVELLKKLIRTYEKLEHQVCD